MRLVDLDPRWLVRNGQRVGFTFLSPIGKQGNTHWRQSCFAVQMPNRGQYALFREAHGEHFAVQGCRQDFAWTIEGGIENATFETMTVSPSLDGSAGGLWHGHIKQGRIE